MSTTEPGRQPERLQSVRGDATGLEIPAHIDALREAGETFLTNAFRAFGAISSTNRVTRITRFEECRGGSTGHKLFLSVDYAHQEPQLHTDLFVKFSRDFDDPIRDNRGKFEMEGEVRFAAVSRLPGFPINVPVAYFADYQDASKTGLLITQRIGFGTNGIEPHHPKCMDHELGDPLEHYRTIVTALARIAAAHKSGRLSADIASLFPFDPLAAAASNPLPYDEQQLRARVAQFSAFVERCPQLFPSNIGAAFFAKLAEQVGAFVEHEAMIKRFLQSNPDFIALCHWNANIDNAWFWRDTRGKLHCGLIDWGHAGQLNVAFALWGSLSGAGTAIWNEHLGELLTLFTDELHAGGGPRLSVAELNLHLEMYAAMMGLAYFLDSPSRIVLRLPEAVHASGPLDPIFRKSETARNQLHMSTTFLNLWQTHDIGASLARLVARGA